ncbi:TPA: NUDIX hydrolase [Candidatus Nomurabacteria bacterium]|nr:MAG: NUDIX hydrolase [Candidatus Nomurabacteria bacterium GW2011_GWE2_36_115]KKP94423.1 MAG: NUDIX hydrolase [Candidatus Nomurabacteria bacterium GW2011_GWF2_36_126]KKP96885.1 MAG: NUDIX hydrolase [Candidatus Nomurabacteria bacterium GW2011_GWD2_36_14]KKP99511.1 MAG: NUDIX hydrolase [Candidatus Nomurabacteria bacterium GW2011_GWF2_36_19]KKQ05633.1 MAG: NUDIX hydrolase [Candidatus Nomurabacteria bacterium GW2011_GWF1_36_47]KKQ09986.1 MAG: NUDIX hydrolase [Candidatus Nomurabacteria bacterium 
MPHINEKIDFCVEVFIVYKNKVLLRIHDKLGFWLSVGGHIELDEDPIEAAIREVKEEVGLDIEIIGESNGPLNGDDKNRNYKYLIPPRYLGRHPVNDKHEHVVFVYFAKSKTDLISESILEHEKGVEMKWMTSDDLNKIEIIPNVKFYALEALKELGEK